MTISREKSLHTDAVINILKNAIAQTLEEEFYLEKVKVDFLNGQLHTYVLENEEFVEKDLINKAQSRLTISKIMKYIRQQMNDIEKEKEIAYFKDKIGHILIGKVQEINSRGIIVQINGFSTLMPKHLSHPDDRTLLRMNNKIQVLVSEINEENKNYNTIVSRNQAEFVAKLLESEIPEIYDKLIVIKNTVRIPGQKSKVAVFCPEQNFNPVSACLGVKGSRIQAIRKEIHNEIIDIIEYSSNLEQYIANAMNPIRPLEIIEEGKNKYTVVVRDPDANMAFGRYGSNVKLAAQITDVEINLLSESEYATESKETNDKLIEYLISNLEVDDMTARLLIACGFNTLESIASSNTQELEEKVLSGYNTDEIQRIFDKSISILIDQEQQIITKLESLGLSQEIIDLIPLENKEIYIKLAEAGIKTIDDLLFVPKAQIIEIMSNTDITPDEIEEMLEEAARIQKNAILEEAQRAQENETHAEA